MARAALFEKIKQRFSSVSEKQIRNVQFNGIGQTTTIAPTKQRVVFFKNKNSLSTVFSSRTATATPEAILPFRVRFINIGIESYGPNNPAPIGIAVIGLNNYIL